jgi:crotonobetainyl-CoA:carnitine CoA-transferase CaiB-like acyl-CoA transferase
LGEIAQCHTPIRFLDLDPPALTDPPALGADTERVLTELADLSEEDLNRLRAAEAI